MSQTNELNERQIAIIPVAAFAAKGDTEKLAKALAEGLNAGLSINDIREILTQMYAYAGFPRSITATGVFMGVLDERKKSGINDVIGEEPKKLTPGADRNKIGTEIQTELVGAPVKGPLFEFSPAIDDFLKEHLFCDIFTRGVLTNQERELATIAALAALPAPAQLGSHLGISLNTGLTPQQLEAYVAALRDKVGEKEAEIARRALTETLVKTDSPASRQNQAAAAP